MLEGTMPPRPRHQRRTRPLQTPPGVASRSPYTTVATLLVLLAFALPAGGQVPAQERAALLDFFSFTNGASWTANTGWGGPPGTECTWHRVTCDTNDRVERLTMRNQGLSGTLPATLTDLTEIKVFDISLTTVSGNLPDLSTWSKLEILSLSQAPISGPLPDLSSFPALQRIFLNGTQITGSFPPLNGLFSLERFASSAGLTGTLPTFADNPNMQFLWVAETMVGGPLPASLPSLDNLIELDLHGSRFTGTIPPLQSLSVTLLDISYNQLSTTDPALMSFLDSINPTWTTQTLPPTGLASSNETPTSFQLDWTPISYTADGGGYDVDCGSGIVSTADKTVSSLVLSGLPAGTSVTCTVATRTDPHALNPNPLLSPPSVPLDVTLPAPTSLTVDFTFSPASPLPGDVIQFTDASSSGTSFSWDFGDGTTSTLQNPQHTYATPGVYTVTLDVVDGASSGSASKAVTVAGPGVTANFTFRPTDPVVGEQVTFLDASSGSISSYLWDFGDGSTSTQQSPTHTYTDAGTYTVRLDVTGASSSDFVQKAIDVASSSRSEVRFTQTVFGVAESDGKVTVTVRLDPVRPATLSVRVLQRTATSNVDYSSPAKVTLQWSAGDPPEKSFDVTVIDDADVEPNEVASLALVELPDDVVRADPRAARIVIENDDFEVEPETTVTASASSRPDIAVFRPEGGGSSGRRVVVWEVQTGGTVRVLAQVFDEQGSALTSPFEVGSRRGRIETSPQVVFAQDGSFAVVWQSSPAAKAAGARNQGNNVGRFFDPSGAPQDDEVELSSPSSEDEPSPPKADIDNNDELVVTWREGDDVLKVRALPGKAPSAPERIEAPTSATAQPEVARTATGRHFVVWQSGAGKAASGSLVGQFFDPQGNAEGTPVQVSESGSNPKVAANDDGGFVVAWEEGPEGSESVEARLFAPDGSPRGAPFPVNEGASEAASSMSLASNATGDFAVAWATTGASASVRLRLFDRNGDPLGGEVTLATANAASTPTAPEVALSDDDVATVVYTRIDSAGRSQGVFTAQVDSNMTDTCADDGLALCLQDNRYEVRVTWRTTIGSSVETGSGQAVKLTDDTGYFWFFDDANVEMVVKVLDACSFAGRFWVFAGGLTDVEVNVVVTDTVTGTSLHYLNRDGDKFEPIQDTQAFSDCSDVSTGARTEPPPKAAAAMDDLLALTRDLARPNEDPGLRRRAAAALRESASCTPTAQRLCLGDGRFSVDVDFQTSSDTGVGMAQALTRDTGYFWFFDENNVEIVIKVLDACALNQHFWVFAGGLTNVAVQLRVTDTETGNVATYSNAQGVSFRPIQDTSALSCSG